MLITRNKIHQSQYFGTEKLFLILFLCLVINNFTFYRTMKRIIYHILFWIFIFLFILDYFVHEYNTIDALNLTITECTIYAIISYTNLHFLINRFLVKKKLWLYGISILVFLFILFIPYHYLGLGKILLYDKEIETFVSFSLNYIMFILISFLYWYVLLYQKEKHKTLELENTKLQSEIAILKSQINPHFLFNSLNNIYSLTLNKKSEEALKTIEILSEILRYFIYTDTNKPTSIQNEIEIIKQYITFNSIKKNTERVTLNIDNTVDYNKYEIIPHILITIIENGFKHSDIANNKDGFLNFNINIIETTLYINSRNTFSPKETKPGIGMTIIKKQLDYFYKDNYTLSINDENFQYSLALTINLTK